MRRFAAAALREVAERRSVLVAAAAAAVLPFLVPLLPSMPGSDAATARALTALVLACAFGAGGAVLVGASVVGRELAEKRLSFHFARPLPAPVIWGGKLVGGLALVLLAEAIIYLPSSLASGRFPGLIDRFDASAMAALLLLAIPLFLLSWVASVALRSRSPWLVVDFVLLAASAGVVWSLGKRLVLFGQAPTLMETAAGCVLLLAIFGGATFALVASGRTDARRGHGAQSVVLWGGLGIFLIGLAVWVDGKVDPGYETFVHLEAEPTGSSGDWVVLTGTPKTVDDFRRARYLVDLRTGRSVLLPLSFVHAVSADGSRATWLGPFGPFDKSPRRTVANLRSGDSTEYPIGGLGDGASVPSFELALSADGSRLAFLSAEGVCDVTDLATGRLLASARVPGIERWFRQVSFESRDVVRIEPRTRRVEEMDRAHALTPLPPAPAIFLLDVPSRALTPVGTALAPAPFFQRVVGPPTTPRAFVRRADDRRRLHLVDLANGAVLASFGDAEAKRGHVQGGSLADGRLFVKIDAPGAASRVVLLSSDGTTLREVSLPDDAGGWDVGFESAPGVLPIARPDWTREGEPLCLLADLNTGETRSLGRLLLGVRNGLSSVVSPVAPPPVGSPATRLFRDADTGRLVLLDPVTGERRALTRGRPAGK
ncbi:MAG: hypothetical protein ACYC4P_07020 [Thermoanaerobaculia bacterium]